MVAKARTLVAKAVPVAKARTLVAKCSYLVAKCFVLGGKSASTLVFEYFSNKSFPIGPLEPSIVD